MKNLTLCLLLTACAALAPTLARAKTVSVEWRPLKGAEEYEIQVLREGKSLLKKRLEDPRWTGELPTGAYTYQIRGIDRIQRPGAWTPPLSLVVMPDKPEAHDPDEGKKITLYDPGGGTTLRWSPTPGVTQYRVEMRRPGAPPLVQVVSGTEIPLKSLPQGKYTWSVSAVLKSGAKQWVGKPSAAVEFEVERARLGRPKPQAPLGTVVPPSDGVIKFRWSAVEGARGYVVEVFSNQGSNPGLRAPASAKPIARVRVAEDGAAIKLSEGLYTWRVRALANVPAAPAVPGSDGPESTADFKLDKNAAYFEGGGYVALSTMFAPYTYKVVSTATNVNGSASSVALTGRVSGEYYFRPQWGVGGAFEMTSFQLGSKSYLRKGFELVTKYRINLGDDKSGWSVSPKFGVEERDYFEILPTTASLSTFSVGAYGLQLGADLRKAFGQSFSVGIKLAYYKPLFVLGSGVDGLSGGASNRNLSFGAQVLYWLSKRWGVGAGGYVELRSLSYKLNNAATTDEAVYMDGKYFFGSLIYSFGR